jgi:hypothetical protein
MAVTYPVTPTTATLANQTVGAILVNYRDGGYVNGTSIVRDVNKPFQSDHIDEKGRVFDFKTATFVDANLAAATPATTDIIQTIPLDSSDVITGGSLRVVRVASAGGTNTATVKIGATAVSGAIDLLTLGTTVLTGASFPIALAATDTADLVLAGTTSPVFDAKVELILHTQPNR